MQDAGAATARAIVIRAPRPPSMPRCADAFSIARRPRRRRASSARPTRCRTIPPRYNLAPTEGVLAVRFNPDDGRRHLDVMRWGLIPVWAKDRSIGNKLINARAETRGRDPRLPRRLRQAPLPRSGRRLLRVEEDDVGQGALCHRAGGRSALRFRRLVGALARPRIRRRSCAAAPSSPAPPNETLAPIHDRMPVILDRADWAKWLGEDAAKRPDLLKLPEALPGRAHARLPRRPARQQRAQRRRGPARARMTDGSRPALAAAPLIAPAAEIPRDSGDIPARDRP